MEDLNLAMTDIEDPFEKLVVRVAGCLISEPTYYKSEETRVAEIVADLEAVLKLDPEYICKLAYYSRNELNLRSTSNFLCAWAANHAETREHLPTYFNFIINLPSDLLDFVEKFQKLIGNEGKPKFPTFLQSLIKKKFAEFSIYQLGKYCSEGKRKREILKGKNKLKKVNMKGLVRLCHIKKPAVLVASILGKKYPATVEEFKISSFASECEFNPEMAGKRMKIPTPATWETTLSKYGNKAECWENLIRKNKLPFMAMLRNIRNLLITGVDFETHHKVVEKLTNPDVIANSRLFPFRFLTAYKSIKVNLEELNKIKENPEYEPPVAEGRRALKFKPKKKVPKVVPTQEILDQYKYGLEEAIKLATALNVAPIRGHTVIFCDASGSMQCPISSGPFGSVAQCIDLGFLFGIMLRHVCESCEVIIFSSPTSENPQCWKKAELVGDNIFELIAQMTQVGSTLGGGTDYPTDWFVKAIESRLHIDNIILFSDMIISESNNVFGGKSYEILHKYRQEVNPHARYITVDLAGSAKQFGTTFENKFKNLVIGGYSDSILKLISSTQTSQADLVRAVKPVSRREAGN